MSFDGLPRAIPSQNVLRELLEYEPQGGAFTWKVGHMAGRRAGHLRTDGYWGLKINRTKYLAHRLAWVWMYGDDLCGYEIDHIDLDKQNNAIDNLRLATRQQQNRNMPVKATSQSGLKGAFYRGGRYEHRWFSSITVNGQIKQLGTFLTAEAAHAAYVRAAQEYFGEFARWTAAGEVRGNVPSPAAHASPGAGDLNPESQAGLAG